MHQRVPKTHRGARCGRAGMVSPGVAGIMRPLTPSLPAHAIVRPRSRLMRFLIGWDNPSEADLLRLYLGVGDNEAEVAFSADELFKRVAAENWDALFLALSFPTTADEGLATFSKVRQELPGVPVVLACRETEMMSLPRFLTRGLRHYLMRDSGGNYVFLAMSALETAIAAARAEEMERLNLR